jgi:hypothetical protein
MCRATISGRCGQSRPRSSHGDVGERVEYAESGLPANVERERNRLQWQIEPADLLFARSVAYQQFDLIRERSDRVVGLVDRNVHLDRIEGCDLVREAMRAFGTVDDDPDGRVWRDAGNLR